MKNLGATAAPCGQRGSTSTASHPSNTASSGSSASASALPRWLKIWRSPWASTMIADADVRARNCSAPGRCLRPPDVGAPAPGVVVADRPDKTHPRAEPRQRQRRVRRHAATDAALCLRRRLGGVVREASPPGTHGRPAREDAVDDHRDARRDQDPERATGGDGAGRQAVVVAVLAHRRHRHLGHRRGGGDRAAAHGREGAAGHHGGHRQPAAQPADDGVAEVVELVGDAPAAG